MEESTDVGAVVPRFLDLRSRRLKEVYVCELRDESLLRNSPDARTAVKSGSCRWHQMSESNDHGATRVAFNFMDVSVAAQYTVHGRGLTIPVINAAFVPILFVYYCRQQLRFFSRSRVLPLSAHCSGPLARLACGRDRTDFPHLLHIGVCIALCVFATGSNFVQFA